MSNNEITYPLFDSLHIYAPNEYYTTERMAVFANRDTTKVNYSKSLLTENALLVLNNIKELLDKHETDYRIVINPLYRLSQLLPEEQSKRLRDDAYTISPQTSIFAEN